jgi:hypothetical protein
MKTCISYFGNRIPRHYAERDLPEIVAAGCTSVLHTFSENDFQFYRGALKEMVEATHQAGLEAYVDPWGVGGVFAGEAFSDFLLRYPECWQVKGDGGRVPLACLNAPEFREFFQQWMDAAIDLGADVLFWDEPRLYQPESLAKAPDDWSCRCDLCQERFHACYRSRMPEGFSPEVAEFREDSILSFVQGISSYVKSQGVRTALCLLPFQDPEHGVMHWEKVAAIKGLDIVGVTPFYALWKKELEAFVGSFAAKVVDLCRSSGKEAQVWLQAFLVEAGREHELRQAAQVAWRAGVRNIAAWGFQGCAHMSALRCQRPEVVWRVLGETFRELRELPE